MQLKNTMICLALVFSSGIAVGQTTASLTTSPEGSDGFIEITSANEDDWTFYLDAENKVYYIDFETISVNLSDVQVTDADGKIVIKDSLWDLPVNTIYELDFKNLKPGSYHIELRTYTGKISRDINIAD